MDLRIRQFLDEVIALVNTYDDIPLEARRLALESAMYNCERASNKAIQQQSEAEAQRITAELAQMPDPNEGSGGIPDEAPFQNEVKVIEE